MADRRHFHHQQAVTEYDRNYKPYQFMPQPLAGKESYKMHTTQEPPLQRKRRIDPPGADQDENYLLAGKSTEKFGPAMLVRDKNPLVASSVWDKQVKRQSSIEKTDKVAKKNSRNGYKMEALSLNLTPETIHVAPKKNTQNKQKLHPQKSHKKTKDVIKMHNKRQEVKEIGNNIERQQSLVNQLPRSHSEEQLKTSPLKPSQSHGQRPQTSVARQSEYQGNYNWKQKELNKLYRQTPLLKTEDIFYRSHLNAPKNVKMPWNTEYRQNYKPYRFITEEDYKRRQSILDKHHVDNSPLDVRVRPVIVSVDHRRAKTPSPDRKGIQKIEVDGLTYTVDNILNPQRLGFPLGPRRMVLSEYQSNYKNFWKQFLESGKAERWFPTEIKQKPVVLEREVSKSYDATTTSLDETSWLQELHELRRRAQEHKKRARGSHFSREHMAQLLAYENRYWDIPSSDRLAQHPLAESDVTHTEDETINNIKNVREDSVRLSLGNYESDEEFVTPVQEHEALECSSNKKPHIKRLNQGHVNGMKRGTEEKARIPSLASSSSTLLDMHHEKVYDDRKYRTGSQYSTSEISSVTKDFEDGEPLRKSKMKVSQNSHSINSKARKMTPSPERIPANIAGRLSTPKMPNGKYQRHHADRTTPNIGGAILTGPNGINPSRSLAEWNGDALEKHNDNLSMSSKMKMHPAGKSTLDDHILVDEPQSSEQLKKSHNDGVSDDQITSVSSLSHRNFGNSFVTSHMKQPVGYVCSGSSPLKTPSMVSNELSLSVRSNPSSCHSSTTHSLALETLERAKKRKEEFWGK